MVLKLFFHPLSSFCQKILIALYENGTPFETHLVDLADETSRADFERLWPIGKFPVLVDEARGRTIPESSIIIEYLGLHYQGSARLLPDDPDLALEARLWDRFYDLDVGVPMQKIVLDRLRPKGQSDRFGVKQARKRFDIAYGVIDAAMADRTWATGETFSLADCAAAPALFYADKVAPIGDSHPHAAAYRDRLIARPSFARVLAEAQPYFALFPA